MTATADISDFITGRLHALPVDSTLAIIFPGQGSQKVGMGRDAVDSSAVARQIFETADRVLGASLSSLCFEGPENELTRTSNAQPAILMASMALLAVGLESGALERRPAFVAGHSLGEYTALVAAGPLTFENALVLVRARGQLMEKAGEEQAGTMAAIVGMGDADVEEICRLSGAEVCNYNSPSQIVVGGTPEAVARACELAKERGGRGLPINVSGAFHTSLMARAARDFERALAPVTVNAPLIPVISNVTGTPLNNPESVITDLLQQVTSPVRWHQTLSLMIDSGVRNFLEIGPGRALTQILKRSYPEVSAMSIDSVAAMASPSNV